MFDPYSPFSMVVLIVLITVGAGVINNWIKMRQNSSVDAETRSMIEDMDQEIRRLRERVKVLEEIATDEDAELKRKISRLA